MDLELVLAVDASSSVDDGEFALQIGGLAAAFRDPAVHQAIGAGPRGAIAVTLVQWSSADRQAIAVPWTLVRGAADAPALARTIAGTPRLVAGGGTSISAALVFSLGLFAANSFAGARRVIDLSGDGINSHGRTPPAARDAAVAAGVTVNGLPILTNEPGLEGYFRRRVIGGPGAFTVPAADYRAFARAMRRKLLREIQGAPEVAARASARDPRPPLAPERQVCVC